MLFKNLCIFCQPVRRHIGGQSPIRSFEPSELGAGCGCRDQVQHKNQTDRSDPCNQSDHWWLPSLSRKSVSTRLNSSVSSICGSWAECMKRCTFEPGTIFGKLMSQSRWLSGSCPQDMIKSGILSCDSCAT